MQKQIEGSVQGWWKLSRLKRALVRAIFGVGSIDAVLPNMRN
jgi:hypothetical protein